jgi:hypothetical protein
MAFGSRQISLVERSRSNFCSCCFYLFMCRYGSSFFFWWHWRLLSVEDPDRWELGSLLGLVGVGRPLGFIFWNIFCASSFINSNTWHLICSNFNLNFIWYCMLMCCVCVFLIHQKSSDMILGDKPLISDVILSHSFWTMEVESRNKQTTSNMHFGTWRSTLKLRLRRMFGMVTKLAFGTFLRNYGRLPLQSVSKRYFFFRSLPPTEPYPEPSSRRTLSWVDHLSASCRQPSSHAV